MEVYILDRLFRRVRVVDQFQSLVWAERILDPGDFELDVASTFQNRNLFFPGVRLAMNESDYVMTVETVQDSIDEEGRRILKVKGPSLQNILRHRMAMGELTDSTTDPKWSLAGLPKDIVEFMFHDICVTGNLDAGDIIAGVIESSMYPADGISDPVGAILYEPEIQPLFDAMKTLADFYEMGFRLVRNHTTNALYFDVYMGTNRTTGQTVVDAVVFSPDLENIRSTNRLTTEAYYKNVAYVISPVGHEVVYPDDVDPSIDGFERRVLIVDADDITDPDGPTASAQMIQRGKEELSKNRQLTVLDGELATSSRYIYGTHYRLNDIVELRDDDGSITEMRVTEQIFISDKEGDRRYPSLSVRRLIVPGSWDSQSPDLAWNDVSPTATWNNPEG